MTNFQQEADTKFAGKRDPKDQSAFYWLTEDEMTFNKERNPPPPVTVHEVKLSAVGEMLNNVLTSVDNRK